MENYVPLAIVARAAAIIARLFLAKMVEKEETHKNTKMAIERCLDGKKQVFEIPDEEVSGIIEFLDGRSKDLLGTVRELNRRGHDVEYVAQRAYRSRSSWEVTVTPEWEDQFGKGYSSQETYHFLRKEFDRLVEDIYLHRI